MSSCRFFEKFLIERTWGLASPYSYVSPGSQWLIEVLALVANFGEYFEVFTDIILRMRQRSCTPKMAPEPLCQRITRLPNNKTSTTPLLLNRFQLRV